MRTIIDRPHIFLSCHSAVVSVVADTVVSSVDISEVSAAVSVVSVMEVVSDTAASVVSAMITVSFLSPLLNIRSSLTVSVSISAAINLPPERTYT